MIVLMTLTLHARTRGNNVVVCGYKNRLSMDTLSSEQLVRATNQSKLMKKLHGSSEPQIIWHGFKFGERALSWYQRNLNLGI